MCTRLQPRLNQADWRKNSSGQMCRGSNSSPSVPYLTSAAPHQAQAEEGSPHVLRGLQWAHLLASGPLPLCGGRSVPGSQTWNLKPAQPPATSACAGTFSPSPSPDAAFQVPQNCLSCTESGPLLTSLTATYKLLPFLYQNMGGNPFSFAHCHPTALALLQCPVDG